MTRRNHFVHVITRGLTKGTTSKTRCFCDLIPRSRSNAAISPPLVMRDQGLFEERCSESDQQGWLLNVYDMSDLTFGRASGWHLSLRQAWSWHFMYHVELLGGKGERGKFTYRHRQMNIAYWSAYETGCSMTGARPQ
ncbi:hypothetical protein CesoFtcFv8_014792 [Champsocephalus esox]|uniref:Uncharacterized protein n=1 Tax=Champsocephalus esox TaxID=159716 RepID=A0AAN8BNV5_9TELE|nr:hypothetical protein CesoFtcFv8_014792 [Champsocephalus esox]